ncbi:MAG: GIY-YIG nuclease family protein [Cyanobacteriota bacterium]|nr:GIY-YIG nuclease family protein [Cyanobacteriota bacterium]
MSPRASSRQGDLFGRIPPRVEQPAPFSGATPTPDSLPLERRQLLEWQERLAAYQAPLWAAAAPEEAEQASLFESLSEGDAPPSPAHPQALAQTLQPLSLPAESLSFWRWPQAPHEGPALYLVLDRPSHLPQPLLLYVGETARADRRWKGAHDCKSYLAAYREALAKAELGASLSIRFWCEAPAATAARRALEQALIQRWKPPFNKETRRRWSTPFTAEGA